MWGFIIIGIIAFFIWSCVGGESYEELQKRKKEEYKEQGLEYINLYCPRYLGGFKDVGVCDSCFIKLFETEIRFQLSNDNPHFYKTKIIQMKDAIDIRYLTQSEVETNFSKKKAIKHGVFNATETKTVFKNYVGLKINHENEIINILLDFDVKYSKDHEMEFIENVNKFIKNSKINQA